MQKRNITKRLIIWAAIVALMLMVPLVAMLFTEEMSWTLSDFVVAGALLFGSGLVYELVARKGGDVTYRFAIGLAVATALLLIWVNLAVGIIGNEGNSLNLMYFGALAIGVVGAFVARFQARGMMRAMFATAIAQILVPVAALLIGRPQIDSTEAFVGVVGVFVLSAFFAAMFVGSALLFRRADVTTSLEKR